MRMKDPLRVVICTTALAFMVTPSFAQLYSQDFEVDDTANWTLADGPTDEFADYFFDYGTKAGIPSAANMIRHPVLPFHVLASCLLV